MGRDGGAGEAEAEVDAAAFCRRLHPALVGGLTLHCRDRAVAQEVAQEALVRAWQHWPSVRAAARRLGVAGGAEPDRLAVPAAPPP